MSDERFRLMVDSVKDYAIFMLDPGGHVVTWNEGAERIKGYRADEIIGEHFSRFYPEPEASSGKCDGELETAAAQGRFEEEGWRLRKDGTRFWANVVITALRDPAGRLVGFAKVTRDLTERRRLEEERLHLAQAEESIRLRDEFLSIASHELKTPLTALQLQLQNMQKKIAALDDSLAPRITRAVRSGQRLADLIEALLDVSRIATGRFELRRECFALGAAAGEVVERLQDTAAKEGCSVTLQAAPDLVGFWDRLRVEQVLTNLLANAIKYGAGSPVSVIVRADGRDAEMEVTDGGPGIPEARPPPHLRPLRAGLVAAQLRGPGPGPVRGPPDHRGPRRHRDRPQPPRSRRPLRGAPAPAGLPAGQVPGRLSDLSARRCRRARWGRDSLPHPIVLGVHLRPGGAAGGGGVGRVAGELAAGLGLELRVDAHQVGVGGGHHGDGVVLAWAMVERLAGACGQALLPGRARRCPARSASRPGTSP
jgi:PAS domain S-box-containing protein